MSSVDDVWASLKDGETERLQEYRKRATALKSKGGCSVAELIRKTEAKAKKKEREAGDASKASKGSDRNADALESLAAQFGSSTITARHSGKSKLKAVDTEDVSLEITESKDEKDDKKASGSSAGALILANEMLSKIARDINSVDVEDINERRRALQKLKKTLFDDFQMSTADYNEVFRECCKPIFRRFADSSEKCRELSLSITSLFFEKASDMVSILGYFFPMLMQRLPGGLCRILRHTRPIAGGKLWIDRTKSADPAGPSPTVS
jgi:hypothetical protein